VMKQRKCRRAERRSWWRTNRNFRCLGTRSFSFFRQDFFDRKRKI